MKNIIVVTILMLFTISSIAYTASVNYNTATNEIIGVIYGDSNKGQYEGKVGYGTVRVPDSHAIVGGNYKYFKHDKSKIVMRSAEEIAVIVKTKRISEIKVEARGLQSQYDSNIAISDKYDVSKDTATIKAKQEELKQEYNTLTK